MRLFTDTPPGGKVFGSVFIALAGGIVTALSATVARTEASGEAREKSLLLTIFATQVFTIAWILLFATVLRRSVFAGIAGLTFALGYYFLVSKLLAMTNKKIPSAGVFISESRRLSAAGTYHFVVWVCLVPIFASILLLQSMQGWLHGHPALQPVGISLAFVAAISIVVAIQLFRPSEQTKSPYVSTKTMLTITGFCCAFVILVTWLQGQSVVLSAFAATAFTGATLAMSRVWSVIEETPDSMAITRTS